MRWTNLRKLSGEAFTEAGKRNYGRPTCIAIAGLVALGTSKGMILIFDTQQDLKATIGLGTQAMECGAITAVALAADHTTVAGGHANGSIFTWEISKPAKPFLHIPPLDTKGLSASGNDGHVLGAGILHLGFLGTRHTALVSADDRGMAFSHLASRGMGPLSRVVHTRRILGRYPEAAPPAARPRKPSSVLACSPLPLGNLESAAESMGLVAMLTPYLLVVVSTTPLAQTQYKASRPKEIPAHGAMSAALAWFSTMTVATESSQEQKYNAKLAYCWLNVLIVVELEVSEESEGEGSPELSFKPRSKWRAGESIVAIQWLSRSVLAMVTITQQLLIFEDDTLRVTESSDLMKKHMLHVDLFSHQLGQLIEKLDDDDASMHGVVADAFYMSFKAYKGRLFLLCFNGVHIGALANWADRLLALMEAGDFINAIRLATAFFTGDVDKATVGLPSNEAARHDLVRGKLGEMMSASLKYGFGKNPGTNQTRVSATQLKELVEVCFDACLSLDDLGFLYDEVYSWYSEARLEAMYLDILERHILNQRIQKVPPAILKDLVNSFTERDNHAQLEEILCHLTPETMDIDQVTALCKKHKLYDALLYVWVQALDDFTTVIRDLLDTKMSSSDRGFDEAQLDIETAMKIFPYLSFTLTGRIYPTDEPFNESKAVKAKAEIYHFLFSGNGRSSSRREAFPYLRAILNLSSSSFMSVLNEAFEDGFLNGSSEQTNGAYEQSAVTDEQRFGLSLNRQYILTILLEILVSPDYDAEDIIYLDMFIARNAPKFPQYILLPGSVLRRVFVELCNYPTSEVAEDCQLSVEYLLSVYQPPDLPSLMPMLRQANFFRVIKFIYRSEKQYPLLLQTYFEDSHHLSDVFDCIGECLGSGSGLSQKQLDDVRTVITKHLGPLTAAGVSTAAATIDRFAPELHQTIVQFLQPNDYAQYQYLREILEVEHQTEAPSDRATQREPFVEQYIRLLCDFDRNHVSDYVESLDSGNLRLSEVLPSLEKSGAMDAAIFLIARQGKIQDAMDRLVCHLRTLETALAGLLEGAANAPDAANVDEAANDFVDSLEKYVRIGIWLCRGETDAYATRSKGSEHTISQRVGRRLDQVKEDELLVHELLWLNLADAAVMVVKNATEFLGDSIASDSTDTERTPIQVQPHSFRPFDAQRLQYRLRNLVQDAFTALLTATTSGVSDHDPSRTASHHPSFLRILRAFLNRAASASPSLAHLRRVLGAVFAAYAYEEGLLALANRLLEKDLFGRVEEVAQRRKRGWRPLGQVCGGCGARVWGPGVGGATWDAWVAQNESFEARGDAVTTARQSGPARNPGKGKGRAIEPPATAPSADARLADATVIFSCRHLFHRRCLEAMATSKGGLDSQERARSLEIRGEAQIYRCPLEVDTEAEASI